MVTKKNDVQAKADDKAITVVEQEKVMTNADLIAALDSVGVKPKSGTVKADLQKLYDENKAGIELIGRLPDLKKACLIKSFGAHGTSKLCVKCKKKTAAVYGDCAEYVKIVGLKKVAAKKKRVMGHATGTDLWFTRKGTYANEFCKALLKSGVKGLNSTEARKAKWNPKGYAFKETSDRLLKEKWVIKTDGRLFVTDAGVAKSKEKLAA